MTDDQTVNKTNLIKIQKKKSNLSLYNIGVGKNI